MLTDFQNEITQQIRIVELCFQVCKLIPNRTGLGSHIYPFLFNLNISKGILSLHSLLDPAGKEISLRCYVSTFKNNLSKLKDFASFEKEIAKLSQKFKIIMTPSLRHKVIAHLDPG